MMRMMTGELNFTWHFCQEMSEEFHVIKELQWFAGKTLCLLPCQLALGKFLDLVTSGSYSRVFSSSKQLIQGFTCGWTSFYCCSSQG